MRFDQKAINLQIRNYDDARAIKYLSYREMSLSISRPPPPGTYFRAFTICVDNNLSADNIIELRLLFVHPCLKLPSKCEQRKGF